MVKIIKRKGVKCPNCKGDGYTLQSTKKVSPFLGLPLLPHKWTCSACGGSGKLPPKTIIITKNCEGKWMEVPKLSKRIENLFIEEALKSVRSNPLFRIPTQSEDTHGADKNNNTSISLQDNSRMQGMLGATRYPMHTDVQSMWVRLYE